MPIPSSRALRRTGLCACIAALAAVPAAGAWAADEGISTDRPDFVESSDTVGKGRFQLETSLAFDRDKTDGVRTRTRSTPTLLRWGATDDIELRLETDGAMRSRVSAAGTSVTTTGFADTSLGLKWHAADGAEDGSRPSMGWLFYVNAPSGSHDFKGQGWRPGFSFTAEWDLPRDYSLGVMTGLYQERNDQNRRYVGGVLAASLGIPLRERWHGFVEVAGQELASNRNGGRVVTLDTGASWQVDKNLQLDAAVFRGISAAAPDWSWTVGVSVRF